jgi:hypothetical protein
MQPFLEWEPLPSLRDGAPCDPPMERARVPGGWLVRGSYRDRVVIGRVTGRSSISSAPSPFTFVPDARHEWVHPESRPTANVAAADEAVRELLFLAAIEGMECLSRGGKGCVFRAIDALRPDIAELWANDHEAKSLLDRFFPDGD